MRRISPLLLPFLLLASTSIFGQVNTAYERLYYVGKAWGHVKYYHPAVADGSVNWDQALLNALPNLRAAATDAEFQAAFMAMLDEAGPMTPVDSPKPTITDSLNNNLDLSWMESDFLSGEVQAYLQKVWDETGMMNHVLIGEQWSGGPPKFDSDNYLSEGPNYPAEATRLLALFRYWNIIHYHFPYKYIMDQPWDETLLEFIPKVMEAEDEEAYHLTMKGLFAHIDDTHAFSFSPVLNAWNGPSYPPFDARFLGDTLVVTKVLDGVNSIAVGDIITSISNRSIADWIAELEPLAEGSNPEVKRRVMKSMILRGNNGPMPITLTNGQTERSESLTRAPENFAALREPATEPYYADIAGNCRIGVIDMGQLETEMIEDLFNDFSRKDALIFDIRNYPNGTLWTLVNYLYTRPIEIATFTVPSSRFAGWRTWSPTYIGQGTSDPYEGEIILLFNQETQSQAEYTVMGLEQHPLATKVGSITAAADGNVARMTLPGNITTYATFLGTYYPDYTPTQRVGIVPDIEVWPTVAGIRAGRDEEMEAAYAALDQSRCLTTGWNEATTAFTIAPNPFSDHIQITWEADIDRATARILDMQGREVQSSQSITKGQRLFTGKDLPPGSYWLELTAAGTRSVQALIKQ